MSHDALDGLAEYLGVFSDSGSLPTSLQGYGYSSDRHMAALGLGAQAASGGDVTSAAGPKPKVTDKSSPAYGIGTPRWQALRAMLIKDVQWGLNQLGYKAGNSGKLDAATKNAYAGYVKLFKQNNGQPYAPDFYPASGAFDSEHWVWANTVALADLGARAKVASSKGGPAPSAPPAANVAQRAPAPAPQQSAGNFVTSVASVQDILVRLGWKSKGKTTGPLSKDMTDGLFGGTTVTNWQQSASKRKLDTTIKRDSGTTVSVNQNTFLSLKNVADQMMPPEKNQAEVPAPSGTTRITEGRLNEVLGRMAGAPAGAVQPLDRLIADYQARAKAGGLDTSISQATTGPMMTGGGANLIVSSKTWDTFIAAFNSLPAPAKPTPAPTPEKKSVIDQAKEQIQKASTTALSTADLTKFFNIAIASGVGTLKGHEPFKNTTWIADYVGLMTQLLQVTGDAKTAWEQLLVPGKLVSKDLKTVKLPADQVKAIKNDIANYEKQQKTASTAPKGFSKVANISKIIEAVNALNISSKTFNTAGDKKELADALQTFIDNAKLKISGATVWGDDKTGIYINDAVSTALAKATSEENQRTAATQKYRDKMVSDALAVSTANITVDDLQLAIIETVENKEAGKSQKIFAKVKNTGTFDNATKDAYAELAEVLTIGPSVSAFEKLLKEQMGPNFKADLVKQTQKKVWAEFLSKAVSKTGIKTLPALAKQIQKVAADRRKRLGDQAIDAGKQAEAKKLIAATVAKSTFLISVFDVQMGLLQGQALKELKAPGVSVTGRTDDATRKAMEGYVFGMIFPKDANISPADWMTYLNSIGVTVNKGAATFGWQNANWLELTQAAANYLSERSGQWMAKHGKPNGYDGMAQIPVTDARFKKATVVKVTVPKPKTDDQVISDFDAKQKADAKKKADAAAKKKSAEQKKLEAEAKKLRDQIAKDKAAKKKADALAKKKRAEADAAKKLAAQDALNKEKQDAAAKAEADARAAEAASRAAELAAQQKAAELAAKEQQLQTQAAGGSGGSGGDVNLTINTPPAPAPAPSDSGIPSFTPAPPAPLPDILPEPAPAPAPPAPEPPPAPAPVEASVMPSWLLMSAVGLGTLFFLKDKKGQQDKRQQTRYPRKRGGRK